MWFNKIHEFDRPLKGHRMFGLDIINLSENGRYGPTRK